MVVFTCNNCGDTLQKPKVAKHYEFRCHSAPFVTCVDCFKDFRGDEYVAHTKCITEAERYGGKDYVPKAGANKGERKQQEWLNIVSNVLKNDRSLSNAEKSFLNILSKYENIPRKKTKFLNFIHNAIGNRVMPQVVESVWDKMESAYKNNVQGNNEKQLSQNGKANEKEKCKNENNEQQENNVIENQNNENINKEIQEGDLNSINSDKNRKKKKSKKRTKSEIVHDQTLEQIDNKINQLPGEIANEPATKKKKKSITAEETVPTEENGNTTLLDSSSINQCESSIGKTSFNWKDTILDLVKSKGEISLKKLQKKVISRYMSDCANTMTEEKAFGKFSKKLKKLSEIVVSDDKVRIA